MKRVVSVVQLLAVAAAALFVVMLFLNEPDDDPPAATPGGAAVDGGAVYEGSCAGCHGRDGGGGLGPQLSDGAVVERFPDVEDQIDVVTNGRGRMPTFGERLSEEEIRAVVEYTRSL